MTELYDYLRLLFARVGKTISPISGKEVKKDDVKDVIETIQCLKEGTKVLLLVPFKKQVHREWKEELNILLQKGFSRLYVNNEIVRIEELLDQKPQKIKETAYSLLIDRFIVKSFEEEDIHRMSDSIHTALYEGEGALLLDIDSGKSKPDSAIVGG
jgi:excinuclease ABC subunit A